MRLSKKSSGKSIVSVAGSARAAVVLSALLAMGVSACSWNSTEHAPVKLSGSNAGLRPLNADERAQDFDQLVQLFKTYYGPYQYKEKKLGISIDQIAATLKVEAIQAKSDDEFAGVVMKFGASLRDGHVQISNPNSNTKIARYVLPMTVAAVEGRMIIVAVDDKALAGGPFTNIEVGDEILSIDGMTPKALLAEILKYRRVGTLTADEFFMFSAVSRPSYMTSLVPVNSLASVVLNKAETDETISMEIPWEVRQFNADLNKLVTPKNKVSDFLNMRVHVADEYNSIVSSSKVDGNIAKMGAVTPFFWSNSAQASLHAVPVQPSELSRKKFGLAAEETPPIFAALYKHQGKNVLLVRIATFAPEDFDSGVYMKAYQALFSDYQDIADVLVLDQTHNPGGSYCAEFYELFGKPGDVQSVQQMRTDRRWINELTLTWPAELITTAPLYAKMVMAAGLEVEKSYDRGEFLSKPFPIFNGFNTVQNTTYKWTKPMLVLADEFAGSCGDMFPMLVKANKRAKIFGRQTMGLGGNVEEVGVLSNSQISVRLTRGLFHSYRPDGNYANADYVENNGVIPDIEYVHTVDDVRANYVKYIKTFSDRAVEQIP